MTERKARTKIDNMKSLKLLLLFVFCFSLFSASENTNGEYKCLPCGLDCDKAVFDKAGKCSKCQMELVKSSSITFKSIKPNSICAYIKSHPKTILLDVRTKEEFEGKADPDFGTLKKAINIPIQELESRISEISRYKNQEIIVYCSHSHRSPQASYLLTQNGFKDIINMSGGMSRLTDKNCNK
jgi:rhodanese-related sulfurtransferase